MNHCCMESHTYSTYLIGPYTHKCMYNYTVHSTYFHNDMNIVRVCAALLLVGIIAIDHSKYGNVWIVIHFYTKKGWNSYLQLVRNG